MNHTALSTPDSSKAWYGFIDRLTLRKKFALMLFFPIVALLYFSVAGMVEKSHLYLQAESSQKLVKFAVLAGALVHETQKERGMTAGFLGSKGKKFADELHQHRMDATDRRAEALKNFLKSFDILEYGEELSETLLDAVRRLNGLDTMRRQIDGFSISTDQAIAFYTEISASFLEAVGHISRLAPTVELANQSAAYINFLQGMERVGAERAILTNTFEKGYFGPGMYNRFGSLVAEQRTYFNAFRTTALPDKIAFYDAKMQASAVAEVEHMRRVAFKSGSASWLYVLLGRLYQNMALRGAYHSIKNLLIRGSHYGAKNYEARPDMQKKYKEQYENNFQSIKKVVERIFSLSDQELSTTQRADVEVIWKNIQDYHKSVDAIIHLQNQGKYLKEIDSDKAVGIKIDDKPADLAIRRLVKSTAVGQFGVDPDRWFETISIKIGLLREVEKFLNTSLAESTALLRTQATHALIITGVQALFNILISLFLAFIISRGVLRQLGGEPEEVSRLVHRIASGNLVGHETVVEVTPLGIMGAMREMTKELRRILKNVERVANDLKDASSQLDHVSCDMSDKTTTMLQKIHTVESNAGSMSRDMESVAHSTEQTSAHLNRVSNASQLADTNLQTISAASEEANVNLGTVVAATEEASTSMIAVREAAERTSDNVDAVASSIQGITSSLVDVRKRCEHANQSSQQATQHAQNSIGVMHKLSESAHEIDSVVGVINNIAEQTNMLALNASIEAAGAGDAGKGFAVVANEVKELARQTGDATRMILERIQIIQNHTQDVASVITSVTGSIKQIDQSNQEILVSVEEQERNLDTISTSMAGVSSETIEVSRLIRESSEGISEITRNISELSLGIDEVTRNVTQAATGVSEVSKSVVTVSHASMQVSEKVSETAKASTHISSSVEDVKEAADAISQMSTTVTTQSNVMNKLAQQLTDLLAYFKIT